MNKIRKKKRPFVFGILTTPAKNIFHSNYHQGLLSGIVPRIKKAGGKLKIIMMPSQPYKSLEEILTRHGLDGLMILTWRWIHPSVAKLVETATHPRVLVVNDPVPSLKVNNLYTDVNAGMRQAVRYLSRKGFRKIGMLHGPWEVPFGVGRKKVKVPFIDTQLKVKGLIRALKVEGIRFKESGFRSGNANSEAEGYRIMKEWLREKDIPEVIVCGNDDLAFGALKAIKGSGRKIAVTGFDDNALAQSFNPSLTTLRQPLKQIGKDAVDILVRQIKSPPSRPFSQKYLPRLVVRKSA